MKNHKNRPGTMKNHKNRHGTMKNQSGTIKTNLELYRVVKGGSGGCRRLPGGSAHFSLHTHKHFIIIYMYIIIIISDSLDQTVVDEIYINLVWACSAFRIWGRAVTFRKIIIEYSFFSSTKKISIKYSFSHLQRKYSLFEQGLERQTP